MAEGQPDRYGQEGGRWVNVRPTSDEITAWFEKNVELDAGLTHAPYVSGITLIPAKEKSDAVKGARADGGPLIVEQMNLVYTPYMKVETRLLYWHDVLENNADWFGVIEPIDVARLDAEGYYNLNLPPGFFRQPVKIQDGKWANFIGCSKRCRIYERDSVETKLVYHGDTLVEEVTHGKLILDAPAGTKLVNMLGRYGEDPNAVMKAETGAVGRALGMAAMLVLPGSGVATAEDMQESQESEGRSAGTTSGEVAPPPVQHPPEKVASEEDLLRDQVKNLMAKLAKDYPGRHKALQVWASTRKLKPVAEMDHAGLRGIVKKVGKELDAGEADGDLVDDTEDTPKKGES